MGTGHANRGANSPAHRGEPETYMKVVRSGVHIHGAAYIPIMNAPEKAIPGVHQNPRILGANPAHVGHQGLGLYGPGFIEAFFRVIKSGVGW